MLRGSIVALITPFKNGEICYDVLAELIEMHIEKGTHALLSMGTTGESPTVSHQEHQELVEFVIKQANKRIPVIAGTGSNSTAESIDLALAAQKAGADYHLSIVPYYNKPSQEGLYHHFASIAKKVDLPMILYNVPGRTGTNMTAETTARLYNDFDSIIGVKEASGNMAQALDILDQTDDKFLLFCGEDALNQPMLSIGGVGSISVTANLLPQQLAEMHEAHFAGDFKKAREIHQWMLPIHHAMFLEGNPVSVKTAMHKIGILANPEVRLPLWEMSKAMQEKQEKVLKEKKLM